MHQKRKELNRENNALDKKICAENQGVFTDMICYLRGSSLSAYDQERVLFSKTAEKRWNSMDFML